MQVGSGPETGGTEGDADKIALSSGIELGLDPSLRPGMLVSLPGRRGVGTVVAVDCDRCKVSLFHSINESVVEHYPIGSLSRALVGPETRVYVEAQGRWQIGRIKDYDTANLPWIEYVVRFPNGLTADVSEEHLRVRVFEPHADPAEVLAHGGGETQYLHDRRWSALATSVTLRAAAEGLTGALSSKIELVPHQLAAARRVLTDPIPRFLLADEVGMGKTIEAGIIARQCLIDDPTRRISVLVPRPLVKQWRRELLDRCDLRDFAAQIEFSSHDEHSEEAIPPDLLIVDEAHNLLGDHGAMARLLPLAHAAPRLLLLSATPALGDPRQLLDLLHVLDPGAYGSNDLPKLKARLELGRDLGRMLLSLADGAPAFLVQHAVRDIATRLPDDLIVADLAQALAAGGAPPEALVDLRQHLADTYRVHQRLIRARRRDAMIYFRPRGTAVDGRRDHLREEVDEDLRWPEILVGLEDWRDATRFRAEEAGDASRVAAQALIRAIEAIGCGDTSVDLSDAPQSLRDALSEEPGDRSKPDVALDVVRSLCQRLRREGQPNPKIVAFATTREAVDDVLARLSAEGIKALRLTVSDGSDTVQDIVQAFEADIATPVLLCDRSGEEGLNLNFADAILHLDLPFSVTRIEQRIGRLDRFGRSKSMLRQRVLLPSDDDISFWAAWLEVLTEGFEIFEGSVSDVQFVLPQLEVDLAEAYLNRGTDGLRDMIGQVQERIAAARRAADEQYALDSVALSDDGTDLAMRIEDAEADEPTLQAAVEQWLVSALQIKRIDADANQVSYTWGRNTLIPKQPWETEFGADRQRALTWRRRVALHRDASLLRPGSPLVDAMERHIRWDDRGSAFATWRVDPGLSGEDIAWTGFRFCYVVEPALAQDLEVFRHADHEGLSRRALAFLPPWVQVLHMDVEGEDPPSSLLPVLARPYDNKVRPQGGRDINLCSRPSLMKTVMAPTVFARLCLSARAAAEARIRQDDTFRARVETAEQWAAQDGRRRRRFDGGASEAEVEALLEAVRSPRLRLDSMGFFVLSRTPPARLT